VNSRRKGLQGKTPKEIQKIYDLKRRELIEQLTNSLGNILPLGEPIFLDVVNAETGKILIPANRNITESLVRKLATAHDHIEIDPSPIRDRILDIIGNYEHAFAELELWREGMIERSSAYQPTARAENGNAQAQYDQWEYQMISAPSPTDLLNQANTQGMHGWELTGVAVDTSRSAKYVGFLKRKKQ
jgi:hypothetical protein